MLVAVAEMNSNEDYTTLRFYFDSNNGFTQIEDVDDYAIYAYIADAFSLFERELERGTEYCQ